MSTLNNPTWTPEEEAAAHEFARGFVALMQYAQTVGITVGFCGPTEPAKTSGEGTQE